MARDAGIYGFCYYYYRFEDKGFMDAPIERMLKDSEVDFPFCMMWCNETWTRAWIGKSRSLIAEQKYGLELDIDLVDDVARFFKDPRYIRIKGRPLFIIYRPSFMPDAIERVDRLKSLFQSRHNVHPILTLAQTDAAIDPVPYNLDGAIEFTANKFNGKIDRLLRQKDYFDASYYQGVYDYDHLTELSLAEEPVRYPLARSVLPHWDKNPRRPGRGHVIQGSTPKKFEDWTRALIDRTETNRFFGERILFVNAWNEWAESAYLEPDTHYGGAYLNSVARAVYL